MFHSSLKKLAFTQLSEKFLGKQTLKDKLQVLNMLGLKMAVNRDIIKENNNKSPQKRSKYLVHGSLEGTRAYESPKGMTTNS